MGSFYDLDDIIKMNEERLEQYSNFYQKNIEKFTTILVLYSAFAIFLIPIIQTLFFDVAKCHWFYHFAFFVFICLLVVSLINSILLLMPVEMAYLIEPNQYYEGYKFNYEDENISQEEVDTLLKSSYIREIAEAIRVNKILFNRKAAFYNRAFSYAILSCIPYLICIGFQLSIKDDKIQKVEIMNNASNLNKTQNMVNDSSRIRIKRPRGVDSYLPGVDSSKVIDSHPMLITVGVEVRFLWDNEITHYIKNFFIKIFSRRSSQLK